MKASADRPTCKIAECHSSECLLEPNYSRIAMQLAKVLAWKYSMGREVTQHLPSAGGNPESQLYCRLGLGEMKCHGLAEYPSRLQAVPVLTAEDRRQILAAKMAGRSTCKAFAFSSNALKQVVHHCRSLLLTLPILCSCSKSRIWSNFIIVHGDLYSPTCT